MHQKMPGLRRAMFWQRMKPPDYLCTNYCLIELCLRKVWRVMAWQHKSTSTGYGLAACHWFTSHLGTWSFHWNISQAFIDSSPFHWFITHLCFVYKSQSHYTIRRWRVAIACGSQLLQSEEKQSLEVHVTTLTYVYPARLGNGTGLPTMDSKHALGRSAILSFWC